MRPTVLLFDIDGTLMDSRGAGRRSIERAFEQLHGRADACAGVAFGGMTDRAIARAGLQAIGAEPDAAAIDALLAAYLAVLAEELEAREAIVYAGIEAALDASAAAGAAVGLGTGNLREGARLKLSRVGLHERFAFGGFGCDDEVRPALLRVGALRGAAALGVPLDACRVVVIGDTPKDVAAAHALGAVCIAVATGSFGAEALAACKPAYVFDNLAAEGAVAALLEGARDP